MLRDSDQTVGACPELDFNDLVERYYRPLYQFAFSLTQSEAEAWDLTQQAFCTWAQKGAQLRDSSKAKAWLFTTLHRAFLQTRRRQARFPHCELGQAESELPSVSSPCGEELDGLRVREALTHVDEVYQTPVSLFYFEERPYSEIAQNLNVPLGTVKSRIARGVGQLRKLLVGNLVPDTN